MNYYIFIKYSKIINTIKLWTLRILFAICVFVPMYFFIRRVLLIFLTPNIVFDVAFQAISGLITGILALALSLLLKEDSLIKRKTTQVPNKGIILTILLVFILGIGGIIAYSRVQAVSDKVYCQNHRIEFVVIEHDVIPKLQYYATVRRIQTDLNNLRYQHQIKASGASLKELHLYANQESLITQNRRPTDVVAFFNFQNGVPSIYIPADIYLVRPESILHEVMHAFMYEILGELFEEIPLWFHDGYAQYASLGWSSRIDKRVETKLFLWTNKPKDLQTPDFLIYGSQYPSASEQKDLFYKSSFEFVDFIESKTGGSIFQHILFDMSGGKPFALAINERIGGNLDSIYYDWVRLNTGLE